MCGIFGIASIKGNLEPQPWISEASKKLSHRGPDSSGEWLSEDNKVVFAHQRLAIIDLVRSSDQPMVSSDGKMAIVFNGEIYNYKDLRKKLSSLGYKFKTNSDTEVILNCYKNWGPGCVSYLNGMFAFAIYDFLEQKLFIARDRAGEKPFFYYNFNGQFYFASELKSLFLIPNLEKKLNYIALDTYLKMGYVPGDQCIIKGFNKLPPAHYAHFDLKNGKFKQFQYWKVPDFEGTNVVEEEEILSELEEVLDNAVSSQLVSDVPVGVLLSGGVDSSLITAVASRHIPKLKTFTIRVPGDSALDETQHARLIADYFNTDHIELDAVEGSVNLIETLVKYFDEPMSDSSMIPTFLVSRLVKPHCSVVLGGDGGDELFGGYGHYSRLLKLEKYLKFMPLASRKTLSKIFCNLTPVGFKGRNWMNTIGCDLSQEVPLVAMHFDINYRHKLVPQLRNYNIDDSLAVYDFGNDNSDLLQRATRMDFDNYLSGDILVKVDRASMANSLEVRAPLLDKNLVEFAFKKVPSNLKANSINKKIILKKLTEKLLPKQFDRNRKQGFSIPLNKWLKAGSSRNFFSDILLSHDCFFEKNAVQSLFVGIDKGRSNSERLFTLMLFELWRREHKISL